MTKKKNNEAPKETSKEEKEVKKGQEAPETQKEQSEERNMEEEFKALKEENEKLKKDLAKEKDDYIRLMADLDNLRRHSAQEKLDLVSTASADTIKGLLPVLDDCERALEMLEKTGDEAAKEGTALIYNKMMAFLQTKGLEVIKAKGEKFDTDFHEAVAQFPTEEGQKGLVFDVVQTGYLLSGKVLRYAKVVVGI